MSSDNFVSIFDTNILWVDVAAFTLLALMLIFIFFANHIYVQFVTSLTMIIMGIVVFSFSFVEPFLIKGKDLLVAQVSDKSSREITNFVLSNQFVIELTYYLTVFILSFVIFSIVYAITIKPKYITVFSSFLIKQNWWKIIYIPLFIVGVSYLLATVTPLMGTKNKERLYFWQFIEKVKISKLTEKNNKYKTIEKFKSLLSELKDNEKDSTKVRKTFIKAFFHMKRNLPFFHHNLMKKPIMVFNLIQLEKNGEFKKMYKKFKSNGKLSENDIAKLANENKIKSKIDTITQHRKFKEKVNEIIDSIKKFDSEGVDGVVRRIFSNL